MVLVVRVSASELPRASETAKILCTPNLPLVNPKNDGVLYLPQILPCGS